MILYTHEKWVIISLIFYLIVFYCTWWGMKTTSRTVATNIFMLEKEKLVRCNLGSQPLLVHKTVTIYSPELGRTILLGLYMVASQGRRNTDFASYHQRTNSILKSHLNTKKLSIIKIRWSHNNLIFINGIPILVRYHLYNDSVHMFLYNTGDFPHGTTDRHL